MGLFRADIHIHSCLSPCGDLEASPRAIAAAARAAGLDLAAITDHNNARNAPAFAAACRREGLGALFGLELTTREEVHALVLFPDVEAALRAGDEAYARLNSRAFDPDDFGDQVWVNDEDEILGSLDRLLILGATDLSLDDAPDWARSRGGLLIPAHIDRPSFGVLGQLGFLPEGPFDAVECTRPLETSLTDPWPVTAASDAHRPGDIARRHLRFEAPSPDFDSLVRALEEKRVTPVFADRLSRP